MPLSRGEVDAIDEVAETFEARFPRGFFEDKVRRLKLPLAITPYEIIGRRDLSSVHEALQAVIATKRADQFIQTERDQWFGLDRSILLHPWFGHVALIIGGIAVTTCALGVYAFRQRRRSRMLTVEFGTNQLFIDAFDNMRAAIAIFDADMLAVRWNGSFEARFSEMLSTLQARATLEKVCVSFHRTGILDGKTDAHQISELAACKARHLREGRRPKSTAYTSNGDSFELSMFPLGARYYAAIGIDMRELHSQQQQLADQSRNLVRKSQQLQAFSAMAAHDLKARLVQQKMLMEFIVEDLIDTQMTLPSDPKGYFATIADLSGRINLLVAKLLD